MLRQPARAVVIHYLRRGFSSGRPNSSRGKVPLVLTGMREVKSEWWAVDGEMHEVGPNVPPRERFVIPRDNLPNRKRKQMREQFMRRTRLVLKETEHDPWCKKYMELYQELRENWERLYWDEGYSKKIAQDHANYESAEDDDLDFSPYRRRQSYADQARDQGFGGMDQSSKGGYQGFRGGDQGFRGMSQGFRGSDEGFRGRNQGDTWQKVSLIRDKFEYDRERRMRDKAFGPMNTGGDCGPPRRGSEFEPFDAKRFFPPSQE